MDKTITIMGAVLAVVAVISFGVLLSTAPAVKDNGISGNETIYFFYGEECTHCHTVMPFVINMTKKYPDADIRILEVWHNETNQQIYQEANAAAGRSTPGVPEVIIGKVVLSGEYTIPANLEDLIRDYLKKKI
jgi:thiol-disulfide isomerase/thioredoxin